MKTWLTYLAAAALGLAAELFFKESVLFATIFNSCSNLFIRLGVFIVFPLVFFGMASSTASLSREKGWKAFTWGSTILWGLFTSMVLTFAAAAIFMFYPVAFPVTTSTGSSTEIATTLQSVTLQVLSQSNPLRENAFTNLTVSTSFLLPLIFAAVIFGWALKPSNDIIRPAYQVMNSFSEVMFRLARKMANIMWFAIFFISGSWFVTVWEEGTMFVALKFLYLLLALTGGVLFVLLPLVYAIFTGFKKNPYKQIIRLFSSATAAFFSSNILFAFAPLYSDCRVNLGVQKKIAGTTLPLYTIFGRGGSAMMGTFCVCALVSSVSQEPMTLTVLASIALACALVSFLSCMHLGYEVLFVSTFAMSFLGIDLYGAESSILALIPVLNGIGVLFDTIIAGLGTSFTANALKADVSVRASDLV